MRFKSKIFHITKWNKKSTINTFLYPIWLKYGRIRPSVYPSVEKDHNISLIWCSILWYIEHMLLTVFPIMCCFSFFYCLYIIWWIDDVEYITIYLCSSFINIVDVKTFLIYFVDLYTIMSYIVSDNCLNCFFFLRYRTFSLVWWFIILSSRVYYVFLYYL